MHPALAWLVPLVMALAFAAAAAGLLVPDVYATDAGTAEMFRGYDLVTAVLAIPCLLAAFLSARHHSVLGELATASLLAYLGYTYGYYVLGAGFNDLFLLHVAVFTGSLVALLLVLLRVDVAAVDAAFGPRTRVRWVAVILGVLAVGLGGMWIYAVIDNAVSGRVPVGSQLVESEPMIHLGIALDLAVLVPLYAVAAVLLWHRRPWGLVLGTIAVTAGLLHQISYMVAMPFQVAAGIPEAVAFDPVEPVIVGLYLLGAVLLFAGARTTRRQPSHR
jgi:hypothetical protein